GAAPTRLAGCATQTGSAGPASRGAKANPELTFHQDHSVGAGHRAYFDRADLDLFLARLLSRAVAAQDIAPSMADITAAARASQCSGADVARLILDGRLRRVERLLTKQGYGSLLVDTDELKSLLYAPVAGISLSVAARRLKICSKVARRLVALGDLASREIIHPVTRRPATMVDESEIEAFSRRYVGLTDLARRRRVLPADLRRVLAEEGVHPALGPKDYGASFYERSDLA
ncbi:MAG TPA: hypothetical protein VEA41_15545, partial [Salinarimonas sp.]|nr:hypothetical protein [Salinarimonas sp.]